jgi:hypothetical protein
LTPSIFHVLVLFVITQQPSCETSDPAAARTERHLRMLAELAEIGMNLAREVSRQALDQSQDAPPAADLALTFSRIARAVRQTVALEAKLAEGPAQRPPLSVSDRWRSARRKRQVSEIVAGVIDAEVGEYDVEGLHDDLQERLDDGDEEADFADRPIGELVARICRDLGITPDWSLFEDEDWAIEEARTRPPGSPPPAGVAMKREGEGRGEGGAGFSAAAPGPAMTHDPPPGRRPN